MARFVVKFPTYVGMNDPSLWLHGSAAQTGGAVERKVSDAAFDRPVSGWLQSSIELRNGLDIAEFSDTMLPEYFDQSFVT